MKNHNEIQKQNFSLIGSDCQLSGHFRLSGMTRIAGQIEGDLQINDEADLVIEPSGKVEGTIIGKDIDIYGEVIGKIFSSGKVSVHSSGKVIGEIETLSLKIEPGAMLEIKGHTLETKDSKSGPLTQL